jgi:hypothetical protein
MEEVWAYLSDDQPEVQASVEEENDSEEDLMTISVQALKGTEGVKTVRLRGFLAGKKFLCWWIQGVQTALSMKDWHLEFKARWHCRTLCW